MLTQLMPQCLMQTVRLLLVVVFGHFYNSKIARCSNALCRQLHIE